MQDDAIEVHVRRIAPRTLVTPHTQPPLQPVFDWTSEAWKEHGGGVAVVVPAEALLELIRKAAGR